MGIGVQLVGRKQVVDAYQNMDVQVWAIYNYKNLMTKGKGVEMLDQFLEMLSQNPGSTIYTIKTYEDLTDPKQVKEKTEASGSLNFRLTSDEYEDNGVMRSGYTRRLEERLAGLEKQLQGTDDDEDQEENLESAVIGLLNNPVQLVSLLTSVKQLFEPNNSGSNKQQNQSGQPYRATVGQIPQSTTVMTEQEKQESELRRLQSAVDILERNDPKLIEHLEKLAMMAQDNPGKFKMLLGLLENF